MTDTTATHDEHGTTQAHGEHAHPGPAEYVKVALFLAVVTAAEVALYYISSLQDRPALMVGLLMFFMVVKFAMVALWFMHLRFDSRIFRRLFVGGIVLALGIYAIVLFSFGLRF